MGAEDIAAAIGGAFALSNGVAGTLLTYAIHSTVWIGAAWLLTSRRALAGHPALQHAVWTIATVAPLLTTALQRSGVVDSFAAPVRIAEGMRQRLAAIVVDERNAGGADTKLRVAAIVGSALANDVRSVDGSRVPVVANAGGIERRLTKTVPALRVTGGAAPMAMRTFSFRRMILAPPPAFFAVALWSTIAGVLTLRIVWERWRLGQVVRGAADGSATTAGVALRYLRTSAGVRRDVDLLVSDDVDGPAALSTRAIALPSRLLGELTPREQEAVLAHELGHVARRDTLWLRVALVIEAIAWFQPLHRLARRRMQLAAEFAADAWAVRVTREPIALARSIARVAEWIAPVSAWRLRPATVLAADGSPLLQRVRRLTTAPVQGVVEASRATTALLAFAVPVVAGIALLALPSVVVGRPMAGRESSLPREMHVLMVRRDATLSSRPSDHLVVIPPASLD